MPFLFVGLSTFLGTLFTFPNLVWLVSSEFCRFSDSDSTYWQKVGQKQFEKRGTKLTKISSIADIKYIQTFVQTSSNLAPISSFNLSSCSSWALYDGKLLSNWIASVFECTFPSEINCEKPSRCCPSPPPSPPRHSSSQSRSTRVGRRAQWVSSHSPPSEPLSHAPVQTPARISVS